MWTMTSHFKLHAYRFLSDINPPQQFDSHKFFLYRLSAVFHGVVGHLNVTLEGLASKILRK